jgi:hypothetical protein
MHSSFLTLFQYNATRRNGVQRAEIMYYVLYSYPISDPLRSAAYVVTSCKCDRDRLLSLKH